MRLIRHAAVATTLALCSLSANAQSDPRFAAIRDTITAIMKAQNLPSLAVAVAKGDKVLWEEGFGLANREKNIAATAQTMYSLASISKPFTATGLMVLVDRGRVNIDKPANDYLGVSKLRVYEGDPNTITVRRVLSHSAGLPLHYQFFYQGGPPQISDDDAIAHYGFSAYPPGDAYFYSNLGFGIIGNIASKVAKKPYDAYMHDEVFEPLGLHNTTVSSGTGLGDRAAVRYADDRSAIAPYVFDHMGASGVWSSAHDLIRFGMFHLGVAVPGQREIISKATRERMQRNESPPVAPGAAYGLGWGTLENDGGYRRVSHTGGMPGVSTVLNLYPSEQLAVVVLVNSGGTNATSRVANAIAGTLLPNYSANREAALVRAGVAAAANPPLPLTARFATLTGTWQGTIRVEDEIINAQITVRPDGDIHVLFGNQLETVLSDPNLVNGAFTGVFKASLRAADATPDSARARVTSHFMLRVRGEKMTGWISAVTQGPVTYGAVSYYAEFTRNPAR